MKTLPILIVGIVFAGGAQMTHATPPPKKPLDTTLPASSVPAAAKTTQGSQARDARGESPPHVVVKRKGNKVIEAYSRGGRVYMVRVTPKHGVPYSYKVSRDGTLEPQPGAPSVTPAMYTVLTWGAPPAAQSSDNGGE